VSPRQREADTIDRVTGGVVAGRGITSSVSWVLAVGVIDFSLEQSIVIPILPVVQAEHRASPSAVVWLITGFLLALAVVTPLAGRSATVSGTGA